MLEFVEKDALDLSRAILPLVRSTSKPEKAWKLPFMKKRGKHDEPRIHEVQVREQSFKVWELPRKSFD